MLFRFKIQLVPFDFFQLILYSSLRCSVQSLFPAIFLNIRIKLVSPEIKPGDKGVGILVYQSVLVIQDFRQPPEIVRKDDELLLHIGHTVQIPEFRLRHIQVGLGDASKLDFLKDEELGQNSLIDEPEILQQGKPEYQFRLLRRQYFGQVADQFLALYLENILVAVTSFLRSFLKQLGGYFLSESLILVNLILPGKEIYQIFPFCLLALFFLVQHIFFIPPVRGFLHFQIHTQLGLIHIPEIDEHGYQFIINHVCRIISPPPFVRKPEFQHVTDQRQHDIARCVEFGGSVLI